MSDAPVIIHVVRHFPTAKNEGRERLRGQLNEPIEKDKAKILGPKVAEILERAGVDCLYCSDLQRGIETARAIARHMSNDPEIEVRGGFRTWDTGRYTGELRDKVWAQLQKYIDHPEIKVPGDERFDGEAFGDDGFVGRWRREVRHQLGDAAARREGKNAWIVHGNEFWTLTPILEGRDPERGDHVAPPPGSVYRLEMNPENFRLVEVFNSGQHTQRDGKSVS